MEVFAVMNKGGQVIELFISYADAEEMVINWNRDEPDRAGELAFELIELDASASLS